MIFILYSLALLAFAALPWLLVSRNLPLYRPAPQEAPARQDQEPVSVLIPARNEAEGIASAIESLLSNRHAQFEIIVMDDHSTDETAAIVRALAARDARVRLEASVALPEGWNGKQHACWQLANRSQHNLLMFLDADVRVGPNAISRTVTELNRTGVDLCSGFPKQLTGTFSEKLLVPMMNYLLLGYLPLQQMRDSSRPQFGAGCGQLFLARRQAYFGSDGHRSIYTSRHDGLKLPRSFREAGFKTDLFDASDIATVRMYHDWREVTQGVLKNANEGMANRHLIGLFTVLLLGGSVLPVLSFTHAVYWNWMAIDAPRLWSTIFLGLATVMSFVPRYQIARRLRQPQIGVWLHPLAVAWFVALQWIAFTRELLGQPAVSWRGRT